MGGYGSGRRGRLSWPRIDGFVEYAKRVSPTCLVHLDRNRYSVPASFANRPVSVRVYPERIVVAAEEQIVCEHARVFARSHERKSTTTVFDWRHYLAVVQRKPGALRNGAPFAEQPPAFRATDRPCGRKSRDKPRQDAKSCKAWGDVCANLPRSSARNGSPSAEPFRKKP